MVHLLSPTFQWKNPVAPTIAINILAMIVMGAILGAVLIGLLVFGGLYMLGFGFAGPIAGSLAAVWQASIGNVAAGSLFALLQSIAMGAHIVILAVAAVAGAIGAVVLDPTLRAKVIGTITTAAKAVYEAIDLHNVALLAASIAASVVDLLKAIAKAIYEGVGVGSLGAASLGATSLGASVVNMTTTAASAVYSGVGAAAGGFRANVAADI
ncbi:hypothetical protein BJV78DRAFT_1282735 [Lactifluus subvellereus]|nr:hypothetical protein BJV78DRAFT_1282735 [Lactifluus subvellereus]